MTNMHTQVLIHTFTAAVNIISFPMPHDPALFIIRRILSIQKCFTLGKVFTCGLTQHDEHFYLPFRLTFKYIYCILSYYSIWL